MPDSLRRQFERDEETRLAVYAMRSGHASRRHPVEDQGRAFDYRTGYQRDRDRIVYSRAFRRLRQKAQTGILPDYEDHRRNRLTHTIEVCQLARTIGRALRLNEDLVEAVAMGHDLGQPPFGPAGARALDDLLRGRLDGRGGAGLGDLGGFWRCWQGLRVVDRLEKRYDHPGLNLTDDVREGILKSGQAERFPPERPDGVRPGLPPPYEVQLVVVADRIATALHDLDDALQSATIEVARVERLQAVAELRRKLGRSYPARAGRFIKANAIHRGLAHMLITDVIVTSERRLARWVKKTGITDAAAYRERRDETTSFNEIGLSPKVRAMLVDLEGFLDNRVRRGFVADRVVARGRRVVLGLVAAYHADPTLLETHVLLRYKDLAGGRYLRDIAREDVAVELRNRYARDPRFVRVLADYVAGMTDTFAIAEHARLLEIGAVPIPSAEQLRREQP
jgi:dGTPase